MVQGRQRADDHRLQRERVQDNVWEGDVLGGGAEALGSPGCSPPQTEVTPDTMETALMSPSEGMVPAGSSTLTA